MKYVISSLILIMLVSTGCVQTEEQDTITLGFVGDIMLDRGVGQMIEANNNTKIPFLKVRDELRTYDVLFGNLESPISDRNASVECTKTVCFQARARTVEVLVDGGFDVVSLANNHALDYGAEVLRDTIDLLAEHNISSVGVVLENQGVQEPVIRNVKGTRIGFLAYDRWNYSDQGVRTADIDETMYTQIKELKEQVDVLVVSLHWGKEYEQTPEPEQVELAKNIVESGADIIVGHHPHVVQGVETNKRAIIAYSLGNFLFDQPTPNTPVRTGVDEGVVLEVTIQNGTVHSYRLVHTQQNHYYQLRWK